MFYFLREMFEKAKIYFENDKENKDISSLISTCDSIILKQPSELQNLKNRLLTPSGSTIPGLGLREDENFSKKLLEILYNDITENTITFEARTSIMNDLSCFYGLKMKILALNYLKELKFKRDLKNYFIYRHNIDFIENLLLFSHQLFQKTIDSFIKKEIRDICETIDTPHIWAFLIENCKELVEKNDYQHLTNIVERDLFMLKKVNISYLTIRNLFI